MSSVYTVPMCSGGTLEFMGARGWVRSTDKRIFTVRVIVPVHVAIAISLVQ
jgi:hypothetical protein